MSYLMFAIVRISIYIIGCIIENGIKMQKKLVK